MFKRLRAFGTVIPLVFGAFGEVSSSVEPLIKCLAAVAAPYMATKLNAPSVDAARGVLAWYIRRRISWVNLRGVANLKIHRSQFVGPGGGDAQRRRAETRSRRTNRRAARAPDNYDDGYDRFMADPTRPFGGRPSGGRHFGA